MSSILLQVGQCGNQIGQEYWKIISKDKDCSKSCVYNHAEGYLRSVNIDSEPKVLKKLLAHENLSFRECNIVQGRRGRGTNWALGYQGTKQEQEGQILDKAIDTIRKEIERCSSFTGVIMMHSLSGGTGSGLGSRLCEEIRENFGLHYIMSCAVAPHISGESPLQHYNSLMCLSWLQRYSDAVILFPNDEILYRLRKGSTETENQKQISLQSINRHIASCVAGVFLPTDSVTPTSGVSIGSEPWEMLRSVCPLPACKFIHLNQVNQSKMSWSNLAGLIIQGLPRYNAAGDSYSSIANLVVARGDTTRTFPASWSQVETKIKTGYNAVKWNPYSTDHWTETSNILGPKGAASLTVASNYSNVIDHLTEIVDRAQAKYDARAYLHWYDKYGCEAGDFQEAFDDVRQIVENYKVEVT